jgi:hypothetical protein
MFAVALVVVVAAFSVWEIHVRALGYSPTLDDTPNLWAPLRARAATAGPAQVVFVGASRTLFDMDLQAFQQEIGGALPIQLATTGSNALIILEDLANEPSYAGTTIVGIVPGMIATAAGPLISSPKKYVMHYHDWSVANRMELPLALALDERLAFINEDLTLSRLLDDALNLPPRAKVYAPKIPGYMFALDRDRQARMIDRIATDPAAQHELQQMWLPLFGPPPKPAVFSDAQWNKMLSDGWESNLDRLKKSVAKITQRGGKVIFSRLPSTGALNALEMQRNPRAAYWDRIVNETGLPGIYFEDYPELSGYSCPEWSHLNAHDATEYTHRFARLLKAKGLL